MITEIAMLTVRPGQEADFEKVFSQAVINIDGAQGHVSHSLQRSVENPNRYLLTVQWKTLQDHTVAFRESPAFPRWRALVGPFFDSPPVVEHFQ